MTIHSRFDWEFGDDITEEFIDEIVRVVKSNGMVLAFALTSRVDQFAYMFMNKASLDGVLKNSPENFSDQIIEIWDRVTIKLNKE